jgi:xanthine dehydrogenase accessory factor
MPLLPRDRTYPCLLRIVMREKRNYVSWCRLIPAHVVVRLQHRGRCITQSANGARPWDDRRRFRRRPPFVYGRSSGRAPRRPAADGESADDGFTDSIFDGRCELAGLTAVRVDTAQEIMPAAMSRASIPVVVSLELADLLRLLGPDAMVDARMRKREYPEHQRGLAPLTIGLGPNFIAADNVDVVIETSWDDLGRIIDTGAARPLAGEPRALAGHGRERFVYASVSGVLRSAARIGEPVTGGDVVAMIGPTPVVAPITGSIRAISRDGVLVMAGTKVLEIDPRGQGAAGIGERPGRIADSVLQVVERRKST